MVENTDKCEDREQQRQHMKINNRKNLRLRKEDVVIHRGMNNRNEKVLIYGCFFILIPTEGQGAVFAPCSFIYVDIC